MSDWIRIVLTLVLLVFVYQETGWATTLVLLLMAARGEIMDYHAGRTFQ